MTRVRGATLIELVFAMAIGLVVLGVGYRAYFGTLRADECEARRESLNTAANNLMDRIKTDVRAASALRVEGGALIVVAKGRQVNYRSAPDGSGVERVVNGARGLYRGVQASFAPDSGGVEVAVTSRAADVNGRTIRVEKRSFLAPRNR